MENRLPLRIGLTLIVVVCIAFSPVYVCDFVNYDDGNYIYMNPHVKTGFTRENVVWAWTSFHSANWHPLTWMSHQLDCQWFQLRPRPHHLVNLFWHLANTIGLYVVLRRMTGEEWRPALVAALFGLHPLHVESVAWVAERKDVLSTFFAIVTLGAYAQYAARPSLGRYFAVLAAFTLGLLAKPMLVTWPFVLLLLDYWPLRRWSFAPPLPSGDGTIASPPDASVPRFTPASAKRLVAEKIPLLILALASSIVTMQAQAGARKPGANLALVYRVGNACVAAATYLRRMVWPTDLAVFYQHYGSRAPVAPMIVSALVLVVLSLLVLAGFRRRPALLVGWLWYLGTLVPVVGLVQVGLQSMADRYTYIPLIGVFMALAWSLPPWTNWQPLARAALVSAIIVVLTACLVLTFRQASFWRTNDLLWSRVLRVADSPIARGTYAGVLYSDDHVAEAEQQCEIALRMDATCVLARARLSDYRCYRGDLEGARETLLEGLALDAQSAGLHHRLGRTFAYQGRMAEAAQEFREACRLAADDGALHLDLATTLARLGDRAGAKEEYQEARRLLPDAAEQSHAFAEELLGQTDSRKHCPGGALFHAEQACQVSLTPRAEIYQTLAEALAAVDRPLAAHAAAERALTLAEKNGPRERISLLHDRVRAYQTLARKREIREAGFVVGASMLIHLANALGPLSVVEINQAEHHALAEMAPP